MANERILPQPGRDTFNCPHCGALTHADWLQPCTMRLGQPAPLPQNVLAAQTRCCRNRLSLWLADDGLDNAVMIYPAQIDVPSAHPDMPQDIANDFQEARLVFSQSPRSSAALLRLCLEKLCNHLVGDGKGSIHEKIGKLVAKGLPVAVQQALDATKIIGNNAIHVIELDIAQNPHLALSLFGLINFIVENQISQPAQVAALYAQLPAGALAAIEKRDKPKP